MADEINFMPLMHDSRMLASISDQTPASDDQCGAVFETERESMTGHLDFSLASPTGFEPRVYAMRLASSWAAGRRGHAGSAQTAEGDASL
jgi:hypothetical protein